MKDRLISKIKYFIDLILHKKEWRRIVSVLACLVVFVTTYALILPAITQEGSEDPQGTNISQYITDIGFYRNAEWAGSYQEAYGVLSPGDHVKISFEFSLTPEEAAKSTDGLYYYQLPFIPENAITTPQAIYDSNGTRLGYYTLSANGLITFDFSENLDTFKRLGISGWWSLECRIDANQNSDDEVLKFPYKDSKDFVIQFITHDEETKRENEVLSVEKSQTIVDEESGTIRYTVTIKSLTGTNDSVNLIDNLGNLQFDGDITVTSNKRNGWTESIENGSTSFKFDLPKMQAEEVYTLTYTAKLPANTNTTTTGSNKVVATTKNENEKEITREAYVSHEFKYPTIQKSIVSIDGNQIIWKFVINSNGRDLQGWKIEDILDEQPIASNIVINVSPALDGKTQITLPYTIESSSTGTYTFTYTTTASNQTLGEPVATNQAKISKGGTTIGTGVIEGPKNNPVKKSGRIFDQQNNAATIEWTATINGLIVPDEGKTTWSIYDQLWSGQWFLGSDIKSVYASLEEQVNNIDGLDFYLEIHKLVGIDGEDWQAIYIKNDLDLAEISDEDKFKTMNIIFTGTLPMGQSIQIVYHSHTPENKNSTSYTNSMSYEHKVYSQPSVTVTPVVTKADGTIEYADNSNFNTNYEFEENKTATNPNWVIKILKPINYTGKMTIEEEIPDGIQVNKVRIRVSNLIDDTELSVPGTTVINKKNSSSTYVIETNYDTDGKLIIILPDNFLADISNGGKILIDLQTSIKDDASWPAYNENGKSVLSFNNKVTVKDGSDQELGTDFQIQTVTKKKSEEVIIPDDTISKSGTLLENQDLIQYSVVINPDGKDLVEGADVLTLKDTLTITEWENLTLGLEASIIQSSVHIYTYDPEAADHKGVELTIPVSYETNESSKEKYYSLLMTIPDKTPLLIVYNYKFNGPSTSKGNWPTIKNHVELSGEGVTYNSQNTEVKFQFQDAQAGLHYNGVILTKIDSEYFTKVLPGAKFEVYMVGVDSEGKEILSSSPLQCETDSDGQITMLMTGTQAFSTNTTYKIVETQAPDHYKISSEPYYFYIQDTGDTSNTPVKPTGVTVNALTLGQTFYISNESQVTEIEVMKDWRNEEGNSVVPSISQVSFQVCRYLLPSEEATIDDTTSAETLGFYQVTKANSWKTNIPNLPKTVEEDGVTYYCRYYIQEVKVPGYEVTYQNNGGIKTGLIKMVNTESDEKVYELPETGGIGSDKFIIIGSCIVLLSTLTLVYRALKKN